MGLFNKLLVVGIGTFVLSNLNQLKKERETEKQRISIPCCFSKGITQEMFEKMAIVATKQLKRKININVECAIVYGKVRSQSGLSEWTFSIDFNDYGFLTGNYWIFTTNTDSLIPKCIADTIRAEVECLNNNDKS